MAGTVEHIAMVVSIRPRAISVKLLSGQDCQGCGVAAICGPKSKELAMELMVDDASAFSVGERVRLVAGERSAWRAIWLGLALPCLLMCAAIAGLLAMGVGQLVAAWSGVAVIAACYAVLYLYRERLVDGLSWAVEKLDRT